MKHILTFSAITAFTLLATGCAEDNPPVQQVYQQPPQVVQQVQPQSEFDGSDVLSAAAGAAAGYALANNSNNSSYNSGYRKPNVVHKTVIINKTVVNKTPSYSTYKSNSYRPSSSYKTKTTVRTYNYKRR
jgi:PBP1b-binding outer membrane lipoprotein LpoB